MLELHCRASPVFPADTGGRVSSAALGPEHSPGNHSPHYRGCSNSRHCCVPGSIRNADSQVLSQTYWVRLSQGGTQLSASQQDFRVILEKTKVWEAFSEVAGDSLHSKSKKHVSDQQALGHVPISLLQRRLGSGCQQWSALCWFMGVWGSQDLEKWSRCWPTKRNDWCLHPSPTFGATKEAFRDKAIMLAVLMIVFLWPLWGTRRKSSNWKMHNKFSFKIFLAF